MAHNQLSVRTRSYTKDYLPGGKAGCSPVPPMRPKIIRPAGVCSTLVTVIATSWPIALPALLDHDHRAVFQVADALADLVARLDDLHLQHLAGQGHRLQGVGQFVQVDDLDALQLGDLVQVEVVGHHAAR